MKYLLLTSALTLTVLSPTPAHSEEKPDTRIALISGDKSDNVKNIVALTEARLSNLPGIALLDRAAIDKVIAEQKLSLAGIVAADQAVTVGKLLSMDLFAVVEVGLDKKEATGIIIFDTRTGVRLADVALPPGTIDRTVAAVVEAVKAALDKRKGGGAMKTVCFLPTRNADLPRSLDTFCESVGQLLEQKLGASPNLGILERRRLDQVNKERDLPTDSPLKALISSTVNVELEIGASSDGKGLRATALLTDNQGKALDKVTATTATRNAAEVAQLLSKDIAKSLKAEFVAVAAAPGLEASRFAREAEFYILHNDIVRALRAAESANALQPDSLEMRALLAKALVLCGKYMSGPKSKTPFGVNSATGDTLDKRALELSLGLARRGSTLLVELESVPPERFQGQWVNVLYTAEFLLAGEFQHLTPLGREIKDDDRAAIDAIILNYNRALDLHMERARKAVTDNNTFRVYTHACLRGLFATSEERFLSSEL